MVYLYGFKRADKTCSVKKIDEDQRLPGSAPNADAPDRARQDVGDIIRSAGPAAAASYTLIGAVIGLGLAGWALDRWLHTSPWLLLGGLLLGMVVGFYELIKSTRSR